MLHGKHQHDPATHTSRRLHKDWRIWVMVLLMLGALAMYVLTLDDSMVPHLIRK